MNEVHMKELGEYLKQTRKNHGVCLEEAAHDLNISVDELENIESANTKAFKDIYELRHLIQAYAKYLGLEPNKVQDEFNDFLFEKTSKLSLEDIMEAKRKREEDEKSQVKKVRSPYTKIYKRKVKKWPIILGIVLFLFLIILAVVIIKAVIKEPAMSTELKGWDQNEYTYKINCF